VGHRAPGLRRTGCDGAINGDSRKIWLNESGKPVIEINLIKGMAHGVPLPLTAKAPLENSGPHAGGWNFVDRTRGWLRDTGSIRPRQQELRTKTRQVLQNQKLSLYIVYRPMLVTSF
jgi:hypothetical protein